MKKDDDIRSPSGMVYDDDRARRSSRTECIERWRCEKVVEARQCLNLRNELVAFLQKIPLLQYETTKGVYITKVFRSAKIYA